nr:PREDICTED: alpha-N-acetylgalactosaminide alpha-2,6-sialyltransferase 2-like [Latimeria chalumnae]|eukprot:XP_005988131.1 PREDICTED: alpha-N-acetylgalactosaminide alpha-2,6-sialyltransferase 2-like [Latimeria chalumnae]
MSFTRAKLRNCFGQSQQKACPNNIRKRIVKSSFKDKFLETIPVLQWSNHATEGEYNRLKNYAGAFGWQNVDFDTIKESLNLLNSSANSQMFDDWDQRPNKMNSCICCAVVGNGGILNDSQMGREINQHDYVFRANGAVVKGFEKDIGNRTSFYIFSTNTMRNSMASYRGVGFLGPPQSKETRYIFLPDHDRDYLLAKAAILNIPIDRGRDKSNNPPTFFGERVGREKFKVFHPDFIRYLRNRFLWARILNSKHRDIYRPSTGAVMLLAAIHTCDEVSAYGFMTPDYTKYSDHYFDKKFHKVVFYSNHDYRLEMQLWHDLHKAGIIRLYQGRGNN